MAFEYDVEKHGHGREALELVECVERIGMLLRNTGVFQVADVIRGDSWTCLLAIRMLEKQGFIECIDRTGLTQEHLYRKEQP